MRSLVPKLLIVGVTAIAALSSAAGAGAAPAVSGKFALGSELGTNNKIAAGPDGNMWFTLEGAKDVGDVTPAGIVQEFELPGTEKPVGIAAGPEGRMWVVALGKATSFLPSDPKGTEETFASGLIQAEPNIVLGPEGLFWVASNNKVAKFAPSNFNGTIKEVPLTGELAPKDIDVAGSEIAIADADQVPVLETSRVVLFNSAGVQHDVVIPGSSQGLAGGPSGLVAFSAPGAKPEQAGLLVPPGPASAFELLGDPFGVAYGADQAFWIVQFAKGQLTRLTSAGQTSALGGLPVESARQIASGPGNTLWVTLQKKEEKGQLTSAIARVSGVELPPPPPTTTPPPSNVIKVTEKPVPDTLLGKHPKKVVKTASGKAKVTFTFSSTVPGSSFQCRLVKPATRKKKRRAKAGFVGCGSPKVLRLAPGKYRFAVRAVADGPVDPSPAESSFRVVRTPRHR